MNPIPTPEIVGDDEWLARFILASNRIRRDHSVKPDAFIPYPYPDLSVARRVGISESELWEIGQGIADNRPAMLYGRADVQASTVVSQGLHVSPTTTPRNHANITGWPPDKPSQKLIAQEIAATAKFFPRPTTITARPSNNGFR